MGGNGYGKSFVLSEPHMQSKGVGSSNILGSFEF